MSSTLVACITRKIFSISSMKYWGSSSNLEPVKVGLKSYKLANSSGLGGWSNWSNMLSLRGYQLGKQVDQLVKISIRHICSRCLRRNMRNWWSSLGAIRSSDPRPGLNSWSRTSSVHIVLGLDRRVPADIKSSWRHDLKGNKRELEHKILDFIVRNWTTRMENIPKCLVASSL